MGILELLILVLAFSALIGSLILCIRKLLRSKIRPYSKIFWYVLIIGSGFFGMAVFLIYHNMFLSRELRSDF